MGPWNGTAKYGPKKLADACYQGDLDVLDMLLFTGDAENKFPGDINMHVEFQGKTVMTPLMLACQTGQIEAVERMIEAKADPHMKCRVPFGKESSDGETAKDIAQKHGWDDIVAVLENALKDIPPHRYVRYGKFNNSRYSTYESGETGSGADPFEEIRKITKPKVQPGLFALASAGAMQEQDAGATTIALMFPGQGSQYIGMLSGIQENVKVKEMIATARAVLGFDILEVCLSGPEDKLEATSVCQPAMFLAGMAGLEKLREMRPEAVERPGAVAGLSLGEYTALCAAGVFTFEEGMELVKVRGAAMQEAAESRPQAMLSVAGLEQAALEKICKQQAVNGEVCQIANVLFPKGFSCAGTQAAINKLKDAAEKAGAMQARLLKTSGGFHTDLMKPAQMKLEEALNRLLPKMKPPTCDVYMNVTGKKIKAGTPPADFVPLLGKQLCSPVLWEPSVRLMIKDGLDEFYEVGPMKQLKAMMKRIDQSMWGSTTNCDV
eukprot:TRINITY_DN95173_c0_g1_i1.p1 TRINITY_DN95173_c0_g1~~TRINITY_DN95173_c0_g1_i1.p1  ORF type:complete len:493 (-),score=156.76 TRINITY_DN95173_c0_g1_i1:48-1526(-)